MEQNSLWSKIIKSKYGLRPNGWDTMEGYRATYKSLWKFISGCYAEFQLHVKFKVGRGDMNGFWKDIWVGDSTLADQFPLLYRVANSHNASISSLRQNEPFIGSSWDLKFFRNLNERELTQISALINLLESNNLYFLNEDRRISRLEGS